MRKVYLFVHNKGVDARDKFIELFDNMSEILTWRYDMISCFYLVSEHGAKIIAERIYEKVGKDIGRFLVLEIGSDYWGWLTDETWYLFEHKKLKDG